VQDLRALAGRGHRCLAGFAAAVAPLRVARAAVPMAAAGASRRSTRTGRAGVLVPG